MTWGPMRNISGSGGVRGSGRADRGVAPLGRLRTRRSAPGVVAAGSGLEIRSRPLSAFAPPRGGRGRLGGLLLALALAAACAERPAPQPPPTPRACQRLPIPDFVVGANVLDHPDDRDGDPANDGARGYGSEAARRQLDRLRALGLTGIVLPVEVRAPGLSSTDVRAAALSGPRGLPRLGRMIADAHDRGLVVVVAPHLLLDDGGWRGDLAFAGEAREAFFRRYLDVVLPIARTAEASCAEALSFALELRSQTADPTSDEAFARTIEAVRGAFSGALTYSANWDEVEQVRFWPLLDGVGVNAFFPLHPRADASDEELALGARAAQARLLEVQRRTGKPLWVLEVGYKALPGSFVEPWLWPDQVTGPVDEATQRRAYAATLRAVREVPAATGVFFWTVPSDPGDPGHAWRVEPPQGFSFLDKEAEAVVRAFAAAPPVR